MPDFTKPAHLSVRLTAKTRKQFHAMAKRFGTPSTVLRELIDAFIEDRIVIQPPVNGNRKEKMYVDRNED